MWWSILSDETNPLLGSLGKSRVSLRVEMVILSSDKSIPRSKLFGPFIVVDSLCCMFVCLLGFQIVYMCLVSNDARVFEMSIIDCPIRIL